MTPAQEREYDATLGALRHHQGLIHASLAPFIALAAPLAAASFVKEIDPSVQFLAALMGMAVCILWALMTNRMKAYNEAYVERLTALETAEPGHMTKDEALRRDRFWLRRTPGISKVMIWFALGSLLGFAVLVVVDWMKL